MLPLHVLRQIFRINQRLRRCKHHDKFRPILLKAVRDTTGFQHVRLHGRPRAVYRAVAIAQRLSRKHVRVLSQEKLAMLPYHHILIRRLMEETVIELVICPDIQIPETEILLEELLLVILPTLVPARLPTPFDRFQRGCVSAQLLEFKHMAEVLNQGEAERNH